MEETRGLVLRPVSVSVLFAGTPQESSNRPTATYLCIKAAKLVVRMMAPGRGVRLGRSFRIRKTPRPA